MAELVKKIRTDKGDLQIDYNALANLPRVNNNLLINSDFKAAVNQRGQTSYQSNAGDLRRIYTIDRWNMQNGTSCTINSSYITLKGNNNASAGTSCFCQIIETALPAYTYTLQLSVKNVSGVVSMWILDKDMQRVKGTNLSVGVNKITVMNSSVCTVSIDLEHNAQIEIEWMKLEEGDVATRFTPRLYCEELNMCRRFFQILEFTKNDVVCYLNQRNIGYYAGLIGFDQMRRVPSVYTLGVFYIEQYNSNGVIYGIYNSADFIVDIVPQSTGLHFGVQFTTVDPVNYLGASSDSLYLMLDAEIS